MPCPASSGSRHPLGLWLHPSNLCLRLHLAFSPVSVLSSVCLLQGHLSLDFRPSQVIQDDLFTLRSFTYSHLQSPSFQRGPKNEDLDILLGVQGVLQPIMVTLGESFNLSGLSCSSLSSASLLHSTAACCGPGTALSPLCALPHSISTQPDEVGALLVFVLQVSTRRLFT